MHIIGILLAAVVAASVVLWRINAGIQASRELAAAAGDAKLFVRRRWWQWKRRERPLERFHSPMIAATGVLVLAIRSDRDLLPEDRTRIVEVAARGFRIAADEAEIVMSQTLFALRGLTDEAIWAERLGRLVAERCTLEERAQVLAMLREIVPEGRLSPRQRQIAERYGTAAGLERPAPG